MIVMKYLTLNDSTVKKRMESQLLRFIVVMANTVGRLAPDFLRRFTAFIVEVGIQATTSLVRSSTQTLQ